MNLLLKLTNSFYPIIVLSALTALFFGKTLTGEEIFTTPGDILASEYPTKYFLSLMLKNYQLPLWNSYLGTGFPVVGTITGDFNPINLLIFFSLPMPQAFNIYLSSIFIMTGFFTYLFAKSLKISKVGSLLSAFTLTFSGTLITKISHSIILQTYSFFPLELYFAENFIQKRKPVFLCLLSFTLGIQLLTGYYQIVLYSLIILVLYFIIRVYAQRVKFWFTFGVFSVAILAGFLIGAVQLLPSIELTNLSTRSAGVNLEIIKKYPYPLEHTITFLWPYILGDPGNGTYPHFSREWGVFWENTGYIGILQLLLAFLAVFWGFKKNTYIKILTILMCLVFLLMLGKDSPLFFVYNIPPLSFFRVPARWIMFVSFFLVILAGFGFDLFFKKIKSTAINYAPLYLGVLVVAFFNLSIFAFSYNQRSPASSLLGGSKISDFLKLKLDNNERIYNLSQDQMWDIVYGQAWNQNSERLLSYWRSLLPNWNVVYGFKSLDLVSTILTKRGIVQGKAIYFQHSANEPVVPELSYGLKNLLNTTSVKYLISAYKLNDQDLNLRFDTGEEPMFFVYENKKAIPRVFLASDWISIKSLQEQDAILSKGEINPEKTVITEREIPKLTFKEGNAKILKSDNISVDVFAKLDGSGLLVLTDSFYPGWDVRVDDVKSEILPVNINQRGVLLNEGEHIVKFRYRPKSFQNGLIISLITSGLLIGLIILLANRKNRGFSVSL